MEDIASKAFRISQDYIDNPTYCDHPILLGFTPEERAWTNKERTPGELVDFVMQDRTRQMILYTAFFINKIGYSGFQCWGSVVKKDGKYYFQGDPEAFRGYTESDARFELPDNENSELYDPLIAASEKDPDSLRGFVVSLDKDGESGYNVILRAYPGVKPEDAEILFHRVMFMDLIKVADIHSFKQLGKFMNQTQKLFVEQMDADAKK